MGHSRELLDMIAAEVRKTYPIEQGYNFTFEAAVPGLDRMMPDILVRDRAGLIRCVVEIGYTRPEKLTAYRTQLEVEDVRWYDKAGQLHHIAERQILVREVSVSPTIQAPAMDLTQFYAVPVANVICPVCFRKAADGIEATPEEGDEGDRLDAIEEDIREGAAGHVITNAHSRIFLWYCDGCGSTGIQSDVDSVEWPATVLNFNDALEEWSAAHRRVIDDDAATVDQLLGFHRSPERLSIETLADFARQHYDVDVSYDMFGRWRA